MVPVPKVAIVGRPNVGKSSIFNWLVGKRVSIVDPTAGVTRDRISHLIQRKDRFIEIVDTGGMGNVDKDGLTDDIERQIQIAIDEASAVVFVMDAHSGVTDHDRRIADRLRRFTKPVLYVVNKCDNEDYENQGSEFYKLGRDLLFVSVTGNRRKWDLLDAILAMTPEESEADVADITMKLALVGRRNAGKSTLINALAESERVIVSEVPGTTRDSVDVRFEHQWRSYLAIDTAGVRKQKSLADSVEFYGFARAQRSIRRADVVLHLLDASLEVSKVDKQLNHYVIEQSKPCIFVINKWDLIREKTSTEAYNDYLNAELPDLSYAPRIFITAKEGKNVHGLLDLSQSLYNQATSRVTTGELNRLVEEAMTVRQPPFKQNRRFKIFYTTQVAVNPPTIVFFCNDPKLLDTSWERFLINYFRDRLPFGEIPIRRYWRTREKPEVKESKSAPHRP